MKEAYIISILSIVLAFNSNSQNYKLIWQDEFKNSGKPNPEKWNYETGFIRNLEQQIYTDRKKNVRVKNGKLQITALRENYRNKRFDPTVKNYRINTPASEYTSGSINTKDKFEFKYGRIEVRAKLPEGNGVWPAIWMLGANFDEIEYPLAGEIDIMEHVGTEPDVIHGTVHFPWDNNLGIRSVSNSKKISSSSEQFHVYSLNWTHEKIEFLIDNEVYHTFNVDDAGSLNNPFRRPFYILLNFALGGNWAGPVDPDFLPQKFLIDYIRVYQLIEE